jgi:hypothetical protein
MFAGKWMELEITTLSVINQTQKEILHVLSHVWYLDLENRDMNIKGGLLGMGPSGRWKGGREGGNSS